MKKFSVGTWITCLAVVLAVAAFFAYSANVGGEGYYKDASVKNLPLMIWGAVLCLAAATALCMLGKGKVIEIVSGILRIAAPCLLAWALMNLIAGRVDGLGYIFFSNADVAKEVQTASNMGSARTAIWNMGFLGASLLFSIVAAFVSMRKKNA